MPTPDGDAIEATYTESAATSPPVEPVPCPGPVPATRSEVLQCARSLTAQVTGLAGALETAALTPGRVRPIFLTAWRRWMGAFLADAARLERVLFKAVDEAPRLAGYGRRLGEWRRGIVVELETAVQVGQVAPTPAVPPISARSWRRWPLWVIIPGSFGAVIGTYMATRYMFRQLLESVNSAGDREQSDGQPQ
jgi:hypothetical protein